MFEPKAFCITVMQEIDCSKQLIERWTGFKAKRVIAPKRYLKSRVSHLTY